MKKPVVKILFDKRNLKEGSYSVKLAVYFQNVQRLFPSGLVLNEKQVKFLKANKDGLSGKVKDSDSRELWHRVYGNGYSDAITDQWYESIFVKGVKAAAKIEEYFSFELFSAVLSGKFSPELKQSYSSDLLQALRSRAIVLMETGNVGNSQLFTSTERSFKRFAVWKGITKEKDAALPFKIISKILLKDYETWMLKYGKASKKKDGQAGPASITMVGIYCRNVRTVFNEAIGEGVIERELYPFSKNGYKIPKANNIKKALDESIVAKLAQYELKSKSIRKRSRDFWLLSYFCGGLNFTDLFTVKRKFVNLSTGTMEIVREKTREKTIQDQTAIVISLLPEAIQIIEEWANEDQSPNAYLFDILNGEMTPIKKKATIRGLISVTNDHMAKITKELEIDVPIRTYEARHTFATALLRSEAPLAFISQALGHSSISTTQKYLGSFEDSQTKKYMSALVPKSSSMHSLAEGKGE